MYYKSLDPEYFNEASSNKPSDKPKKKLWYWKWFPLIVSISFLCILAFFMYQSWRSGADGSGQVRTEGTERFGFEFY